NADLRDFLWQRFPRTQIKGHTVPAPVFDLELPSNIGLSRRLFVDPLFVPVIGQLILAGTPRPVLGAHHKVGDFFGIQGPNATQQVYLLIAYSLGVERNWRL